MGCSPTPDRPSLGRAARARYPLAVDAGVVGVGARHQPPSACSCELALPAAGAARGRLGGGGTSCLGVGRPGLGAIPRPTAHPWGVRSGLATHWLWVRGMWTWGPVSNPPARPLASWLCALRRRQEGAQGGAPLAWVWDVRGWALSHARSPVLWECGWGPLPTGCGCGVRAWGPGSTWHPLLCRASSCVVRASRVCGTRWPSLLGTCSCAVVVAAACLSGMPRRPAPRSGCPQCSGRLSCRRGTFLHPRGCRPRIYCAAARGTWRPAENRALCACRWPLQRQGRWARSVSYLFGAPRSGCPWRVPRASVLGCVRCSALVSVDLVTDASGFRSLRLSMRDAAGAPGLFCVDADTSAFGSEDATPGSRACVPVRAVLGQVGRAGVPGAFWCASPFLWPFVPSPLFSAPFGLGFARVFFFSFLPPPLSRPRCLEHLVGPGPECPWPWRSSFAPAPLPFFCLFFRASLILVFLLFQDLGPLGPGALWLPAPPPYVSLSLSFFFFGFCCFAFLLFLLPAAPRALGLCFAWLGFFFFLCVRPCVLVCALRAGAVPPPPPPGSSSSCFARSPVLLRGAAVCCGLFCVVCGVLRCFSVPCGAV